MGPVFLKFFVATFFTPLIYDTATFDDPRHDVVEFLIEELYLFKL